MEPEDLDDSEAIDTEAAETALRDGIVRAQKLVHEYAAAMSEREPPSVLSSARVRAGPNPGRGKRRE